MIEKEENNGRINEEEVKLMAEANISIQFGKSGNIDRLRDLVALSFDEID